MAETVEVYIPVDGDGEDYFERPVAVVEIASGPEQIDGRPARRVFALPQTLASLERSPTEAAAFVRAAADHRFRRDWDIECPVSESQIRAAIEDFLASGEG